MGIKVRTLLATAGALVFAAGFSLSLYAFDCEQCLGNCEAERLACLKSGQFTVAQCNQSFHTCWKLDCGFCELP